MTDAGHAPDLEDKIRAASAAPDPDPGFVRRLRGQLVARGATLRPSPRRVSRRWTIALGAVALLLAVFFMVGPGRVVDAMRQMFGFLPGLGLVEQGAAIRVLAEPVSLSRDSVNVAVKEALLTAERTVIVFTADGIPREAYPRDESITGCSDSPQIRLPDGRVLRMTGGEGRGWASGYETRALFPPAPAGAAEATFVLPCLQNTLPGAAPENWELPLRFVPAPPELTVAPVIEIEASPTAAATVPATLGRLVATAAPASFGIALALDRSIPLADGYYVIGHATWTDERLESVSPGSWSMKLLDAAGQAIPLEPVDDYGAGLAEPGQWAYRVYGQVFNGPLTLRAEDMEVTLQAPITLSLDPRAFGFTGADEQLGTTWDITPVTLDVPGLEASLTRVKYLRQGDLKGFEFTLQADPALRSLPFSLSSPVSGGRGAGAGGSSRGEQAGQVLSYVLTDGAFSFPMALTVGSLGLSGAWEITWDPPAPEAALTPTPVPQACLTLDQWKTVLSHPISRPETLSGKLIGYGRIVEDGLSPSPENYGVFVYDLSTGEKQVLGPGTWPALAPDGSRAVYGWDDGLHVVELATGQGTVLPGTTTNDYRARWSPDGGRIAFVRADDLNLYVVNADGSGLQRVTDGVEYEQLLGWSADGRRLIYTFPGADGQQVRSLDLASGAVQDHLAFDSRGASAAVSPDGGRIAFNERVPGKLAGGLYLANLDGSARRLLAQLEHWAIGSPVWSPDDQWLIVGVINTDQFAPASTPALINLETCQAIPLADIEGEIQGWAP